MKTIFLTLFTFILLRTQAQINLYLTDIEALKSILQRTPSYKAQIKGQKLESYNILYKRLKSDTTDNITDYKYFYNLSQLLFPLRDNHLAFYQLPNYNNFKDNESIERFLKSKDFSNYPTYKINIDSLKLELAKKIPESIEGIYHYDKFYSVGLFKNNDKEYIGVIIDSNLPLWQKGQIAIHLYEYKPNLYKAIYGHPSTKHFIFQPIEKYRNQSLVNSYFYASYTQAVYSKKLGQLDFINLPKSTPKFELKNVSNDIQYLLVKTFQANNSSLQKSNSFYDSIKSFLKAPNLILDLRNNEGGAKKATRKYYNLIKKYSKKGKVYILLNNGTLSQAEIFILKLKKNKNTITIGQTTNGMLTYGHNYDGNTKLPSQQFVIAPTDMKGRAKFLNYEDVGINPDIFLTDNKDWIEQVVEIIREK